MLILTPEQSRALDERTMTELGLPAAVLMETAGRAIAQAIVQRLGSGQDRLVTVLAGAGNNGGDGFVAARALHNHGFALQLLGVGDPAKMTPETRLHYLAAQNLGLHTRWWQTVPDALELREIAELLGKSVAIVDALAGIGPTQALREPLLTFCLLLDGTHRALTVAADVPSGLHAGTGEVLGAAVKCDLVVTMAAAKAGLFLGQGPELWRELTVADIGVPRQWLAAQTPYGQTIDDAMARDLLPHRSPLAHKGKFGHLLVVAGSPGKAGAALLTSSAALRSGVGLCTLATHAEIRPRIETELPDLMVETVEAMEGLLARKTALAVGPGLGTGAGELLLVRRLLAANLPIVLDADGLTLLASQPELAHLAAGRLVLTPHPGEMATLLAKTITEVEANRLAAARLAAQLFGAVVVLKGSRTLVVHPDGRWAIAMEQNPALAKAGSGDVLTGVLGSLLAQGLQPFEAARLAVAVHAMAGRAMREKSGQRAGLASELSEYLVQVWTALERVLAPTSGDG